MRAARPRFAGHAQPKVPACGYEDESRPEVMARKIATAAEHGITAFIFDWYWYGTNRFLERGLEQGFLQATNSTRLKFALMWANHEWVELFPATADGRRDLIYPTATTSLAGYTWTRHYLILNILDNVASRLEVLTPAASGDWKRQRMSGGAPGQGSRRVS